MWYNLSEIQHENAKLSRPIVDVWCLTVILSSVSCCKCVYDTFFFKARGQCPLKFWCLFCLGISVSSSYSAVLAESRLSWVWALEHAKYSLCDCGCCSNKTSLQLCLSSVATTSHWDTSLSLFIMSSDTSFGDQQASFLAHGFWSVCLMHGCAECTKNVQLSLCLLLLSCPHRLHMYLGCEICCVC